jgi:vacuolar-type H+-ATPase subunit I/STV1
MPVAKLKKITIVSTQSIKAEVIKELEGAGAVQITDFHMGPEERSPYPK